MKVVVYTQPSCSWCDKAKTLLDSLGIDYEVHDLSDPDYGDEDRIALGASLDAAGVPQTVPQVFVGATRVGGYQDLKASVAAGLFLPLFNRQGEFGADQDR